MAGEARPAVDLDEQFGKVDLGQPRLDQLPQPSFVGLDGNCGVDDEAAVLEVSFGCGVPDVREALEQCGLFVAERPQARDNVDGSIDRLRKARRGSSASPRPAATGSRGRRAGDCRVTHTRPARNAERSSWAAQSS
jgi:hypothetical protein